MTTELSINKRVELESNIPKADRLTDVKLLADRSPENKVINVLMPGLEADGILPTSDLTSIKATHAQITDDFLKVRIPQAIHEATLKPVGLEALDALLDQTRQFWGKTLSPAIILPYMPADANHAYLLDLPLQNDIGTLILSQEGWDRARQQLQSLIRISEELQLETEPTIFVDNQGNEQTLVQILEQQVAFMHAQIATRLTEELERFSNIDPLANQAISALVALSSAEAEYNNGLSPFDFDKINNGPYVKIPGHPTKLTLIYAANILRSIDNTVSLPGLVFAAMIDQQLACVSELDCTPPENVKQNGANKRVDIVLPTHLNDPRIKAVLDVPALKERLPNLSFFFDTYSGALPDPTRRRGIFNR